MNYEKDIRIDPDALDVEWLQQASLTFTYADHCAKVRQDLDYVKQRMDIIMAELDSEVRSDPEEFGLEKITEAAIRNAIIQTTKYQEIHAEYLSAKYEYEMAQAAIKALDQKKSALENLVRLHGQSYFAGPTIPRDISKEWEQVEKGKIIDKGVATAMKRKKKKIN